MKLSTLFRFKVRCDFSIKNKERYTLQAVYDLT